VKSKDFSQPNQLGVGTPKGTEAAAHAIRSSTSYSEVENQVVLKIDFKNAFNCVSRNVMSEKAKEHTPKKLSYVFQCYTTSSNLYYGDQEIIKSKEDVRQRDPLGPFLFSHATHDLVKSFMKCWD